MALWLSWFSLPCPTIQAGEFEVSWENLPALPEAQGYSLQNDQAVGVSVEGNAIQLHRWKVNDKSWHPPEEHPGRLLQIGQDALLTLDADGSLACVNLHTPEDSLEPLPSWPKNFQPSWHERIGETLYVSGEQEGQSTLLSLSLEEPTTWKAETLPSASQPLAMQLSQGQLYLLTKSSAGQTQLWKQSEAGSWDALSTTPTPVRHLLPYGMASLLAATPNGELWSYHTVTDRWHPLASLSEAPQVRGILAADDVYYVAYGDPGQNWQLAKLTLTYPASTFGWLDYTAIALYMAILLGIGWWSSSKSATSEDFFLGGRKIPFWAVGLSLYATGTSAISFMAIPAKTFATDWTYIWINVFSVIGFGLLAVFIVPLIRRLNITSTYEYLEMRFNTSVRLLGAVICVVSQVGGRMSVVLFLPALALSTVTGIDIYLCILVMGAVSILYTVMGGIHAVIWTDVLQVAVLFGGALIALGAIIWQQPGGVGGLIEVASSAQKFDLGSFAWSYVVPGFWILLLFQVADIIAWPRDQVMMQRIFATNSDREAAWSVWTLNLVVVPGNLLFFFLGTALFAFYQAHPAAANPALDLDATFPHFIVHELPAGVAGLVIAALFAASMSTLDSSMNSVATVSVVDFYQRFFPEVTDEQRLHVAHIITIVVGFVGVGAALLLATFELPSLWDLFIKLMGLLGGGFGGVYALGLLTKRANGPGVLIGTVTSVILTVCFDYVTDANAFAVAAMATFSCVFIGYVASLFIPSPPRNLKGLTVYAS